MSTSFIQELDFDILGLAETHLVNDQGIQIPHYTWYGQNRAKHVRARMGSGGVGFLVHNRLLNDYNVTVLDTETEGILWLLFSDKHVDFSFSTCVAYLPPANSPHSHPDMFFESLLAQVAPSVPVPEHWPLVRVHRL